MSSSGVRLGTGNAVTLSEADAKELVAQCPDVELAAPVVRGAAQVVYANNNWGTSIYGITPDYLTIRDLSVADGAEFTQQDIDGASKVAVLGQTPVDNLFDGADPIGQIIRIKNVPFTVVGVLTPKGQSTTGQDQDDVILLPIATAKRKVIGVKQANADAVDTIMMQANPAPRFQRRRKKRGLCSGNATICRPARRMISRSVTCKNSSQRRRRLRASWPSCWRPSLRSRWLWVALEL